MGQVRSAKIGQVNGEEVMLHEYSLALEMVGTTIECGEGIEYFPDTDEHRQMRSDELDI